MSGDHQGDRVGHGGPFKAVYAYSVEDYRWWEQALQRELDPANFGENLTLEGIDLRQALVGEKWRVGTAVLRVTQPRTPCFKLGIRMGDPRFPRRFSEAERPGAYLAIEQEGEVGAGDPLVILERPAHPVTLQLLAHLNYRNRDVAHLIEQAVHVELDRGEWEELVRALDLPPEYLGRDFTGG